MTSLKNQLNKAIIEQDFDTLRKLSDENEELTNMINFDIIFSEIRKGNLSSDVINSFAELISYRAIDPYYIFTYMKKYNVYDKIEDIIEETVVEYPLEVLVKEERTNLNHFSLID